MILTFHSQLSEVGDIRLTLDDGSIFSANSGSVPASRAGLWLLVCVAVFSLLLGQHSQAVSALGYGYKAKYSDDFSHFDYVNPDALKGGVLHLASLSTTYDSFNPFILKGNAASGLELLVFETLMVSSDDEPYSVYGLLADDIKIATDALSVTFHINEKARFSDGSRVTADDVKFSFDTLKSKKAHPGYRIFWNDIQKAVVVDEQTVRFEFANNNPELPMMISGLPVFSQKWVGDSEFDRLAVKLPIASGPYTISDYDFGKQVRYQRNPDYWGKDLPVRRGMFNFDSIVFKYYKDRTIALEAFKAGEFDYMSVYSSKSWARDYRGKQFDQGKIKKARFEHKNNEGIQGFVFNTRRALFKDRRVRQALTLAFDFEWANRMLFFNQYTRSYSYFSNSELAARGKPQGLELEILQVYKDQLPEAIFDTVWQPPKTTPPDSLRKNLRQALKLLRQAGWQYRDGALRNQQGQPFEFHLMLASKAFERIAAAFARNLEKLGIKMSYRIIDQALYRRKLQTFDFDMTTMRYGQKQSPGNELINRWHSRSAAIEGSANHPGIVHPVIDQLLEQMVKTRDRDKLIAYARAIDRILLYEHYMIPQWFIAYHRVAYWDIFQYPQTLPKYYSDKEWMIQTWWMKR